MRIAVYYGGTSMERDVSLISGKMIGEELKTAGHDVIFVDPAFPVEQVRHQVNNNLEIEHEPPSLEEIGELDHSNIFRILLDKTIAGCDFHFIGLHGGIGENGLLQGMMEHLGYRFNGSGYSASALAMDKHLTKQIMHAQAISTPDWIELNATEYTGNQNDILEMIADRFQLPCVIKPNSQGSTIGLSIVENVEGIREAVSTAFQFDEHILVEQFIPGREITATVLGEDACPLVEIKPTHQYYDYECKYTSGMTEYETPAQLPDLVGQRIRHSAVNLFKGIGCSGYARVDFRVNADGEAFCLEINTLPGMTKTSLVPKSAAAAGISFPALLDKIITLGMQK